jgi:hypothetical protein
MPRALAHHPAGRRNHRLSLLVIFVVLLAAMCLSAPAQTTQSLQAGPAGSSAPKTGLYRIAGTAVNAATGEPLRHTTVAALSEEDSHTVASVETRDDGHFALENLPPAKYQLTASKRGFRTAFYDEHDEFSSAIVTGPGLETENLTFRLTPGATLYGVVTADGGDPVENAKVLLFLKPQAHKRADRIAPAGSTSTDDTGAYEFTDLAPGEYLLAVTAEPWYAIHPSANRSSRTSGGDTAPSSTVLDVAYPVTFFESTTEEAAASPIALAGAGREEANINLHAVPALRIEVNTPGKQDGSITRAELRQTVFGTQVSAVSAGFLDALLTGTTDFTGVAPGHYELEQGDPPRTVDLDATASLQVDPTLGTPTVAVSGTLHTVNGAILDGEAVVMLQSHEGAHHANLLQSRSIRGAFTFPSVPPGDWDLSVQAIDPQQQLVRPMTVVSNAAGGVTQEGNHFTVRDRPLSVVATVSEGATRVQGFAKRENKGVAGVMIVLVPRNLNVFGTVARRDQSDSDGSFSLLNVVPGQYTVVAIQDGWDLDWEQPDVISRYLPNGIPVTVTDSSGKLLPLSRPVLVQTR